jgi:competence protein ComFC
VALKISRVISHFFPNRCEACDCEIEVDAVLCSECGKLIKGPIMAPFELAHIDRAYSYWSYDTPLREMIHAYKFGDRPKMAGLFSKMLLEMFLAFGGGVDTVVPVPTTAEAFRKRGFDTNHLILKKLSGDLDVKIEDVLVATGKSSPQSRLKLADRHGNVEGKFRVKRELSTGKIILFDDVVTTGATVGQCARVLREKGVKEITLFSIAKAKK